MQAILGTIFHFIGGFASGSFYMPYKKVRGWHWESYWIIGGFFSWLIVPPLAAWFTVPGFSEVIKAASADTIKYTLLFGVLWVLVASPMDWEFASLVCHWEILSCWVFVRRLVHWCHPFIIIFILRMEKQLSMTCLQLVGDRLY